MKTRNMKTRMRPLELMVVPKQPSSVTEMTKEPRMNSEKAVIGVDASAAASAMNTAPMTRMMPNGSIVMLVTCGGRMSAGGRGAARSATERWPEANLEVGHKSLLLGDLGRRLAEQDEHDHHGTPGKGTADLQ